jgi:uncharacterized protein YbbC (DUF1343 family)
MVRIGLVRLLENRLEDFVSGKRIGLVSHSTAGVPDLTGIVEAMLKAGMKLSALFGPEHGFYGAAPAGVKYSLYGEMMEPSSSELAGLDALVVDFQDVGARFYTFLSTLYYVMRKAASSELPVFVLDRPNPLNGCMVEGPLVEPGMESFIGVAPIPIRHGMTLGELALYLNNEMDLKAALTVFPMDGWQRAMWFDETGLPWVPPSPAMPHLSTAIVYPGMCFLEGTNLSEGRGTALPFEIAGAPWLDGYELGRKLNRLDLPGVGFRPHLFMPMDSKYAGMICQGVQVHVFNRWIFQPVLTGLQLLATARELYPESFVFLPSPSDDKPCHLDLLAGSSQLREDLIAGRDIREIANDWISVSEGWNRDREPYLLYK